jgi:hypothetical protein
MKVKIYTLKILRPISEEKRIILNHQFGFRQQQSTIEQVDKIAEITRGIFEIKPYCSAVFLDITQASDKLRTQDSCSKLEKPFPMHTTEH